MLFAYIIVALHVVSLVMIQVDDGVQKPVYYVSKLLHKAETGTCYTEAPSLLLSSHCHGPNPRATILGAFDIKYMPRTSIKGQVLADLVVEFTESLMEEDKEK